MFAPGVRDDPGVASAASLPLPLSLPGVYGVAVHNADYSLVSGQNPLARNEFAFVCAEGLGRVSKRTYA